MRRKCHCISAVGICLTTEAHLPLKMQNLNALLKCHRVSIPHVTNIRWVFSLQVIPGPSQLWVFACILAQRCTSLMICHIQGLKPHLCPLAECPHCHLIGFWKAGVTACGQGASALLRVPWHILLTCFFIGARLSGTETKRQKRTFSKDI